MLLVALPIVRRRTQLTFEGADTQDVRTRVSTVSGRSAWTRVGAHPRGRGPMSHF